MPMACAISASRSTCPGRAMPPCASLNRACALSMRRRTKSGAGEDARGDRSRASEQGSYEQSGVAIRRAVAIQGRVNAEHPEYAETLTRLAQQLWFEGRLPESKATSRKPLRCAERTLRADHPTVARSRDPRRHPGRPRRSGAVASSSGNGRLESSNAIGRITETAVYMDSVAMAELRAWPNTLRPAVGSSVFLKTLEARLGPSHDFVATARLNLALVDARLGDYAGAGQQQRLATAIWEGRLERDHPCRAWV